jgi:ketosteroid isomerase-like protein
MKSTTLAPVCAAALLLFSQTSFAGDDPKVAAEIMSLARGQWAAEAQGKAVAEQTATLADDYTEFNPDYPVRIDGKAINDALYEALARSGERSVIGEMMNPKVQVYGNTAILTYNYVGVLQGKDGQTHANAAKSTRVYVKMGDQWKLVHANFAPVLAPSN